MAGRKNKDGLIAGSMVSKKDHDRVMREKRKKLIQEQQKPKEETE